MAPRHLLFGLVPALLLSVACGNQAKNAQLAGPPPAMPVKVQVAQAQPVGDYTEYLATLKSRNAAVIQPQVDGNVTKIFVTSGTHLAEGQPLMEIDPQNKQATVHS